MNYNAVRRGDRCSRAFTTAADALLAAASNPTDNKEMHRGAFRLTQELREGKAMIVPPAASIVDGEGKKIALNIDDRSLICVMTL